MLAGHFPEEHKIINIGDSNFITAPEDFINGSPNTDVINMENWRVCTFVIIKGAGATGTATITIESCDDVIPTTATAVAFMYRICTSGDTFTAWTTATSSGFGTTAGADQVYEIMIRSDELSGENSFVRMQITELVDGAVDGGTLAILTGPRYAEDINATAIV